MTLGQVYKALSIFFAVLAAIAGYIFLRMRWARGADFDVTGFLWIASNLGRLIVLAFLVVFFGVALSYWVKSWRSGG